MPYYFIRTVNCSLKAHDNGSDYESEEDAVQRSIHAGAEIALAEIRSGADVASVEVTVENQNGTPVRRTIVTIAATEILPRS